MISVSLLGATGKMGRRILALALEDPELHVSGISARISSTDLVAALSTCDVAIDFTSPLATKGHLEAALITGKPLVIGTTGHTPEDIEAIEKASRSIPILYSPNFSLGIALCLETAEKFGKALGSSASINISETHHIHKKDSPSGTALALAKAAGLERAVIESIRSGDTVGEHTVIFELGHERIELKHTCLSRDVFALGALRAAKFLAKQSPGLYSKVYE